MPEEVISPADNVIVVIVGGDAAGVGVAGAERSKPAFRRHSLAEKVISPANRIIVGGDAASVEAAGAERDKLPV